MSSTCNNGPSGFSCGKDAAAINSPEGELWLDLMSSMLNFAVTSTSLMKNIQTRKTEMKKEALDASEKLMKHLADLCPKEDLKESNFSLQAFPTRKDDCEKETCNLMYKSQDLKGELCQICSRKKDKTVCGRKRHTSSTDKKKTHDGYSKVDTTCSQETLRSANLIPPKLDGGDCTCKKPKPKIEEIPKKRCDCEKPAGKPEDPLCTCPKDGPPADYCDAATSPCPCPEDQPPPENCDASDPPCPCPQEGPPADYCDAATAPSCICPEDESPTRGKVVSTEPCICPESGEGDAEDAPCICPKDDAPVQMKDTEAPDCFCADDAAPTETSPGILLYQGVDPNQLDVCECPEKPANQQVCEENIVVVVDELECCTCPGGDAPACVCTVSTDTDIENDDVSTCTCPSDLLDQTAPEPEKEPSVTSCACQTVSSENVLIKELQLANLTYQLRQTDKHLKELKKEMDRIANLVQGKRKCSYAYAAALYDEIMKPRTSVMGVNGPTKSHRMSPRRRHQGHF